jgi:hypothetical protein
MLVAFDPGMKNLGVWAGSDPEHTFKLGKFCIKKDGVPLYEATVNLLSSHPWMCDSSAITEAVVETQAPRNVPARIVATAIYAFLKGRGVSVRFSGSKMKDSAIKFYGGKLGVKIAGKPNSTSGRYRANKRNSVLVASAIIGETILERFGGKLDDVCDAAMLGAGLFLDRNAVQTNPKK